MSGLSEPGSQPEGIDGIARGARSLRLLLTIAFLLAAAGFSYWRFVYYPSTPQYALREFLDAAKHEQYAVAYRRLYVPSPLKLVIPTPESLDALARDAGGLIPRLEDYELGKVRVTHDRAVIETVLVTRRDPSSGHATEDLPVEMVRRDGQWKVDGSWAIETLIQRGGRQLLRSLFNESLP